MTKKRTSAADLVKGSGARNVPFIETLSDSELAYFWEVVEAMSRLPEASPYVVARRFKEELGLAAAESTIVRALRRAL